MDCEYIFGLVENELASVPDAIFAFRRNRKAKVQREGKSATSHGSNEPR